MTMMIRFRKAAVLGFALGACGALGLAGLRAAARRPRPLSEVRFSSWVAYWDEERGHLAAREQGRRLEEIAVFAADFDGEFRLVPSSWTQESVQRLKQAFPGPGPRILLTVVNDVRSPEGSSLKNPDI